MPPSSSGSTVGTGSNKVLDVTAEGQGAGTTAVQVTAVANTWTEITISLSAFGYPSTISRLNFFNNTGSALTMITFDDIRLEGATGPSYALTVTKAGTATGTVTSVPAGISCGSDCSESYPSGWSVTLTASVTTGSAFAGWSGACTGTGTCTVTMDAAKSVTATFNPSVTYTLSVTKSGAGVGGVTSSPAGVSCGSTCSEPYDSGTVVTLVAFARRRLDVHRLERGLHGYGHVHGHHERGTVCDGGVCSGGTTVAGGLRWVGRVDASNANAVRFAWQGAGFVATVTGTTMAVNLETTGSATVYFQSRRRWAPGHSVRGDPGRCSDHHSRQRPRRGESRRRALPRDRRHVRREHLLGLRPGHGHGRASGQRARGGSGRRFHQRRLRQPGRRAAPRAGSRTPPAAGRPRTPPGSRPTPPSRAAPAVPTSPPLLVPGWGMYRDNTGNTSGVLSSVYENAVGTDDATVWGFNPQASVVIINLGTNDYAGADPGTAYETAYVAFVQDVRAKYPNAWIFLTIGSMLGDTALAACKAHLANVVTALGDPKVVSFDLGIQPMGL